MSSIARKETIITETNNILKNKIDELYISINAEGESLADKIEGILDSIKEYEERTISNGSNRQLILTNRKVRRR